MRLFRLFLLAVVTVALAVRPRRNPSPMTGSKAEEATQFIMAGAAATAAAGAG